MPVWSESYHGQGIYFSNSFEYTDLYASDLEDSYYLISMVAPGNAYPVAEQPETENSLQGMGCLPGYQSHIVLVDSSPERLGRVIDPREKGKFAELVIFDPSSALPLFLLKGKKDSGQSILPLNSHRPEWKLELPNPSLGILLLLLLPLLFLLFSLSINKYPLHQQNYPSA